MTPAVKRVIVSRETRSIRPRQGVGVVEFRVAVETVLHTVDMVSGTHAHELLLQPLLRRVWQTTLGLAELCQLPPEATKVLRDAFEYSLSLRSEYDGCATDVLSVSEFYSLDATDVLDPLVMSLAAAVGARENSSVTRRDIEGIVAGSLESVYRASTTDYGLRVVFPGQRSSDDDLEEEVARLLEAIRRAPSHSMDSNSSYPSFELANPAGTTELR
jgi:hypothetical protein